MKILLVGGDYTWSIERLYIKYLKKYEEVDVIFFTAQNYLYKYLDSSIINKIKHRFQISPIYKEINIKLVKEIQRYKPDILWVFKGMEVSPETLLFAKKQGVKLVNYNPDNPFIFSGRGSGNKYVTDSIELFDLYLTYSMDIREQLISKAKVESKLLPFAFEIPGSINYENLFEVEEIKKACFIGNPDKDRAKIINEILDAGTEVVLFGNNWQKFISNVGAEINQPVYGDELWYTLRKYRVQINMLRKHNLTSHNMRSFEIPGIGGIQLAPYTKEHAAFFTPEKNIFLYNTTDEAVRKIQMLVNLSKEEADAIRASAYNTCLERGYTYEARAGEVYKIFQDLL